MTRVVTVKATAPRLVLVDETSKEQATDAARLHVAKYSPIFARLRQLAPSFPYDVFRTYYRVNASNINGRAIFADVYRVQNHVTDDRVTINGVSRPLSEIINEVTPEQLAPYNEIAHDLRTARDVLIEPTYVIADGDTLAVDLDAIERANTFEMSDYATAYYNALDELATAFNKFAAAVQMRSAPGIAGLRRYDVGWRVDTEWVLFHLPHAAKDTNAN